MKFLRTSSAVSMFRRYFALAINLFSAVLGLVSLIVSIWSFDYFDLHLQIVISTGLAAIFLQLLLSLRRPNSSLRRIDSKFLIPMLLPVLFLLIIVSDSRELLFIVLHTGLSVTLINLLWIYWQIAQNYWLLLVGIVPTIMAGFVYVVTSILQIESLLELILPLPFALLGLTLVLLIGLSWALFARWSLDSARNSRGRPLMGPAMEGLTMFLLVVPPAALAILLADVLTGEAIWVAVVGIVMGLLFSNAISMPFAQFLRALGELSENPAHQ